MHGTDKIDPSPYHHPVVAVGDEHVGGSAPGPGRFFGTQHGRSTKLTCRQIDQGRLADRQGHTATDVDKDIVVSPTTEFSC